jgi:hypothetical protein
MSRIVRDIGMLMLVGLVVHVLYSQRPGGGGAGAAVQVAAAATVAAAPEVMPAGFSVLPWAP